MRRREGQGRARRCGDGADLRHDRHIRIGRDDLAEQLVDVPVAVVGGRVDVVDAELDDSAQQGDNCITIALREEQQSHRPKPIRCTEFMLGNRGMMDTLRARMLSGSIATSDTAQRINEVIAGFLARGAQDGTLRSELRADDVTVALLGVLTTTSSDDAGAQAGRLLDLLMRGLTAEA